MNTETMRESQPTECKTPIHELVVRKCWKPDCRKVATGRDGSGWEWCDDHFDQEKTGSVLHTKREDYDVDFYKSRAKEMIESEISRAIAKERETTIEGIVSLVIERYDTKPLLRTAVSDYELKMKVKIIDEIITTIKNKPL